MTKEEKAVIAAARHVVMWWEIDCGWGVGNYEKTPNTLRRAINALDKAEGRTKIRSKAR